MKVVTLKLITGEEIICELINIDRIPDSIYVIKNPKLVTIVDGSMVLTDWIKTSCLSSFRISDDMVLMCFHNLTLKAIELYRNSNQTSL